MTDVVEHAFRKAVRMHIYDWLFDQGCAMPDHLVQDTVDNIMMCDTMRQLLLDIEEITDDMLNDYCTREAGEDDFG